MLRSYKYIDCQQAKLHEFIIAFFDKIEFEKKAFDDSFFEPEFKDIAKGHRELIKGRCKNIYEGFKTLSQSERSIFCKKLKESNDIQAICNGTKKPLSDNELPTR